MDPRLIRYFCMFKDELELFYYLSAETPMIFLQN